MYLSCLSAEVEILIAYATETAGSPRKQPSISNFMVKAASRARIKICLPIFLTMQLLLASPFWFLEQGLRLLR